MDTHFSLNARTSKALSRAEKAGKAVGLAVGVTKGDSLQSFYWGTTGRNVNEQICDRSLFEIGTITSVFTTTLLADMHLRGEVDLDAPVGRLMSDLLTSKCKWLEHTTLRHLATHTSGLPKSIPLTRRPDEPETRREFLLADLYEFLKHYRVRGRPGKQTYQSHVGIALLGHALEKAVDSPLEDLIRDRITVPLGMIDTSFTLSHEQQRRSVVGHTKRLQTVNAWNLTGLAGAGGLVSSLPDMLRFAKANAGPPSTQLKEAIELAQQLHTFRKPFRDRAFVIPVSFCLSSMLLSIVPFELGATDNLAVSMILPSLIWRFGRPDIKHVGLGWHASPGEGSRVFWFQAGTERGFASIIVVDPQSTHSFVILCNTDAMPTSFMMRVFDSAMTLN